MYPHPYDGERIVGTKNPRPLCLDHRAREIAAGDVAEREDPTKPTRDPQTQSSPQCTRPTNLRMKLLEIRN